MKESLLKINNFIKAIHDYFVAWFEYHFLFKKLNSPIGYLFFIISSLGFAFLISKIGLPLGGVFFVGLVGTTICLLCFFNVKFGFFLTVFLSFFVFYIKRLLGETLPIGAIVEIFLFLSFVGIFVKMSNERDKSWKFSRNHITYAYLIFTSYILIQAFNPHMDSIEGWLFIIRKTIGFMMAYFITLYIFDLNFFKQFIQLWIGLALLAAIYGCYQEWFGMPKFEEDWVRQDNLRFGLYFIEGRFRKFSFLSDPTAFGILMAISGLFCLVLTTGGVFNYKKKIILLTIAIFMFLGMAYSGTRTAYAMIPIGIIIFTLMTINNKNTLILTVIFLMVGIVIVFGPIYGNKTVNRIRSTFKGSEDASLNVRDVNRARIQPYIYDHPIGGGLSTSGVMGLKYNPDHFLAGFPPDSGYLRTSLEIGWLGLLMTFIFYYIILRTGIKNFYRSRDPHIKIYYAGFITYIFSLMIAHYAQVAIGQIPGSMIFYASLAILSRLKELDGSFTTK